MAHENSVIKRLEKVEEKTDSLERQVSNLATKVDLFVAESRAARADMKEDMRQLSNKIDNTINGMFITVAIGVGAMVVAVLTK